MKDDPTFSQEIKIRTIDQENGSFRNKLAQLCPIGQSISTRVLTNNSFNPALIARNSLKLLREGKVELEMQGAQITPDHIDILIKTLCLGGEYKITNLAVEDLSGVASPNNPEPKILTEEQKRKLKLEEILNGSRNQSPQATEDIDVRRRALADLLNRPSIIPTPASSNSPQQGPQRY